MEKHEAMREFIQNRLVFGMSKAIGYDDDLLLSGLLDSLNVIRLLAFIQEHFGVDVPPEDVVFENFSTINAIVHYLERK